MPIRVIVGLCLTGFSLLFLIVPGDLVLPLVAAEPLASLMRGGCFNPLGGLFALAMFGLAAVGSLVLIGIGIAAIVLTALQTRGGIASAVIINVIVGSLFLMFPLGFTPGEFSSSGELAVNGAFYSAFGLLPLAAAVLLLAPTCYRSRKTFVATLVAAIVLAVPGAIGLTAFGLELAGPTTSSTTHAIATDRATHC